MLKFYWRKHEICKLCAIQLLQDRTRNCKDYCGTFQKCYNHPSEISDRKPKRLIRRCQNWEDKYETGFFFGGTHFGHWFAGIILLKNLKKIESCNEFKEARSSFGYKDLSLQMLILLFGKWESPENMFSDYYFLLLFYRFALQRKDKIYIKRESYIYGARQRVNSASSSEEDLRLAQGCIYR